MESILLQLYNGEIFPAEQFRPKMEEYVKMRKEHYHNYEDFTKKLKELDPALYGQFIKIMDEQFCEIPLEISEMFIDGFKLGAKMMIEVLQNKTEDK
ncbi:DUF6809 family protein [Anaerovorax odorimutans]|uniref:DUF6809 family protein n=1 Tax=Anaerovorax odorimutans TaxID=109327 RepID=UPI00041FE448|nr:DUF6809 family protein [Anaerovorax odorimutans]